MQRECSCCGYRVGGDAAVSAGVQEPLHVPVVSFAKAQVIHERNSPRAEFLIFPRIIK